MSGRRRQSLEADFLQPRKRPASREPRYGGWNELEPNEVRRLKKAYQQAVRRGLLKYQHPRRIRVRGINPKRLGVDTKIVAHQGETVEVKS